MLEKILIKNFATIKELELDFNSGFSALTGETGAGKSIIIDALGLLLGNRGSDLLIRTGFDTAEVQGIFNENKEEIIITRILNRGGRNTVKINGELVSLKELNQLGEKLAKISAQFDNQDLLNEETQFNLVENYGKNVINKHLNDYQEIFPEYAKLRQIIKDDSNLEKFNPQRIELLQYQLKELEDADISENEIVNLEAEEKEIKQFEKKSIAIKEVENLIGDNAALNDLQIATEKIENLDDTKLADDSKNILNLLADLNFKIQKLEAAINFDEDRISKVRDRLSSLRDLERKYKVSGNELIALRNSIQQEINDFNNHDELIEQNKLKFESMRKKLLNLAEEIHLDRVSVANELSDKIVDNLSDLLLENARFEIRVENLKQLTENGFDDIEFYISTNPGQDLAPLNQTASGGEISRVLLAVSSVFSRVMPVSTMVFDEIDTGVSGRAAYAIARKMLELSKNTQILSITHLPQVAANAEYQYEISKVVENDETYSTARILNNEQRIDVIASLLAGDEVSSSAIENAKELLKNRLS